MCLEIETDILMNIVGGDGDDEFGSLRTNLVLICYEQFLGVR